MTSPDFGAGKTGVFSGEKKIYWSIIFSENIPCGRVPSTRNPIFSKAPAIIDNQYFIVRVCKNPKDCSTGMTKTIVEYTKGPRAVQSSVRFF
jgi:hypothetical protein